MRNANTGQQTETPYDHFYRCGPFCSHVRFCERCSDERGLCEKHAADPPSSVFWKEEAK